MLKLPVPIYKIPYGTFNILAPLRVSSRCEAGGNKVAELIMQPEARTHAERDLTHTSRHISVITDHFITLCAQKYLHLN